MPLPADKHAAWANENVKAAREACRVREDPFNPAVHIGHRANFDWHKCGCWSLRCDACGVEGYRWCAGHHPEVPEMRTHERVWGFTTADLGGPPVEPHESPMGQDLSVPCRYWLGTDCVRNPCKCTCPETGDGELA